MRFRTSNKWNGESKLTTVQKFDAQGPEIQINGELVLNKEITDEVLGIVADEMSEICGALTNLIIRNTPYRTHRLQEGNDYTVIIEGKTVIGRLYNDVEYAPYVHEGTSKIKANPFMKKVVDSKMDIIRRYLNNII